MTNSAERLQSQRELFEREHRLLVEGLSTEEKHKYYKPIFEREQLAQKRSKFAAVDFNDLFALSNKRGEKLAKGVVLAVPLKTNGLLGFLVRLYVRLSKKALVATWEQTHIPPTRDSRSLSIDID